MQDGNYPEAVKAIEEAVQAKTGPQDYLAYLKGWALCLGKQYEPAIAALEQVEKQYPQSPWLRRARFAKAVAYLRNQITAADAGDFESRAILLHALAVAGQGDRGRTARPLGHAERGRLGLCPDPVGTESQPT